MEGRREGRTCPSYCRAVEVCPVFDSFAMSILSLLAGKLEEEKRADPMAFSIHSFVSLHVTLPNSHFPTHQHV